MACSGFIDKDVERKCKQSGFDMVCEILTSQILKEQICAQVFQRAKQRQLHSMMREQNDSNKLWKNEQIDQSDEELAKINEVKGKLLSNHSRQEIPSIIMRSVEMTPKWPKEKEFVCF